MLFKTSIGKNLYYEIHGQGEPLIMLNGIMMSTASWKPFLPNLTRTCKVILVDMLDMGQSDSMDDVPQYEQSLQADVLAELVRSLKLEKVSVMGISYGGEVALQFALNYPALIDKLMLFNTSAYTFSSLWDSGLGWNRVGATGDGKTYYDVTIPYFYSAKYQEENAEWMQKRYNALVMVFSDKTFLSRMDRLVMSTQNYDVRARLGEVNCRTLILGSRFDSVIPLDKQELLHRGIKGSSMVVLPESGHCSMMESPDVFVSLISGFVNLKDPITV